MALLVIVLSVAAPSLSTFFRGRTLDAEARRFLALTRYGQSRAVSEGVPMLLWIDARAQRYGLEAETGTSEVDRKALEFAVDQNLELEVERAPVRMTSTLPTAATGTTRDLLTIRFTPEGFISDTSPERVLFRRGEDDLLWVGQSQHRLYYEIQTNRQPILRR